MPFERGPDELKDLPAYFGKRGRGLDLSRHDMRIFAEIVDASALTVDAIVARAVAMRAAGADVIDLGCLPDTPFPHLEDAVRALKAAGFRVSVDSADVDELRRGASGGRGLSAQPHRAYARHRGRHRRDAGADSRRRTATWPRCCAPPKRRSGAASGRSSIRCSTRSTSASWRRCRATPSCARRLPDADILMGTGNLTELTDADSSGVTAMLLGICSELHIRNVLVVQVSPHTRRTIEEHDAARRIMFAAREDASLPQDYGAALLQVHDKKPFPNSPQRDRRGRARR